MTHKASWIDLSVSKFNLLAPLIVTETVDLIFFGLTPVISTILEPEDSISSMKSAEPNPSSVKLSILAIG